MNLFNRPVYLFFILTILICDKGYSQTNNISSQENSLVNLYSKLLKSSNAGEDSIRNYYSDKFGSDFKGFIKANPATLTYPFKKLIDSNYYFLKTSSDGNFRVYSWDTETGGTMRFFNQIYQYKSNGKVFTKIPKYEDGDPRTFCSQIFTVYIKGKVYYLTILNGIYSTKDASQSIAVYTIQDNKLVDTVKLFKTKTKYLNTIDVEFDFFSVVDRPERPLELITYDEKRKIIYIPVVNDKDAVINKNIRFWKIHCAF